MLREGPPQHAARIASSRLQLGHPCLVRLPRQLHHPIKLGCTGLQPGCQAGINSPLLPAQLLRRWRRLADWEGQHSRPAAQVALEGSGVGARLPAAAGAAIHQDHQRYPVTPQDKAVISRQRRRDAAQPAVAN